MQICSLPNFVDSHSIPRNVVGLQLNDGGPFTHLIVITMLIPQGVVLEAANRVRKCTSFPHSEPSAGTLAAYCVPRKPSRVETHYSGFCRSLPARAAHTMQFNVSSKLAGSGLHTHQIPSSPHASESGLVSGGVVRCVTASATMMTTVDPWESIESSRKLAVVAMY